MPDKKNFMKSVLIKEYGSAFVYTDHKIPIPGPDEVLVQVIASGLCSTDLHLLEGRMNLGELPRIPGHEIAGLIVETGSAVRNWRIDQRVTVAIDVYCGTCRHCLTGNTQRCSALIPVQGNHPSESQHRRTIRCSRGTHPSARWWFVS